MLSFLRKRIKMFKWLSCFFLGHRWIEKGKTYQNKTWHGERLGTVNFILQRCEKCSKYKEYETRAYYDEIK